MTFRKRLSSKQREDIDARAIRIALLLETVDNFTDRYGRQIAAIQFELGRLPLVEFLFSLRGRELP